MHMYNPRPPSASHFLRHNQIQGPYWTTVSYVNRISHYFCLKQFVEVLSIKHAPYHLHDGMICMLHYSILLRHIRSRRLFSIPSTFKKCLNVIVETKRFDFVLRLHLYKCFELVEFLKATPFGLQHI